MCYSKLLFALVRGVGGIVGSNPRFIELDMLHAFAFLDEGAVDRVQSVVGGLDDGGVVIGASGLVFEMPGDRPGFALVVGDGNGESIAALEGVVVDQNPMAVSQSDSIESGAGVGQFDGLDGSPCIPLVIRFAHADLLREAIFTHVRDEGSVVAAEDAGLDVAETDQRLAGAPGVAGIIADGHQGKRVRVAVEGQEQSAGGELRRFATRLPAEALIELVGQTRSDFGDFGLEFRRDGWWYVRDQGVEQGEGGGAEVVRLEPQTRSSIPDRGTGTGGLFRDELLGDAGFPRVG